jgi:hypothetical protein
MTPDDMMAVKHDFKVMTRSETQSGSMTQKFESKKVRLTGISSFIEQRKQIAEER